MHLSEKQIRAYCESDARINIFQGAVRSGKSFIALLRFLKELKYGPEGEYIIVGKTERTVIHNVIEPLRKLTKDAIRYNRGLGEFSIFNRKVYVVGAVDERSEGKIRGSTFAGALVDELTIIPESFFRMLLSRLSIANAKLIGTTNPDSPYHWLKSDFIDRSDELNLKIFNFTLDDNPSLTKEYVSSLKREYRGLWYKRFIEGNWVLAEGSIFDFFDQKIHTVRTPPSYAKYYLLGVDYGTTNAFAATLVGFNDNVKPALWVEKEYYWDSRKTGMQKTDLEYATDLKREFGAYPIRFVYLDPAAASFEVELRRAKWPVKHAKNEVLDGIRTMSNFFIDGNLVICRNCTNLIREIEGYVWDDKSVKLGEDRPVKQRDHAIDACLSGNSLITCKKKGNIVKLPIKLLVGCEDYQVMSFQNDKFIWKNATHIRKTRKQQKIYKITLQDGKVLSATEDHEMMTQRGFIMIKDLLETDEILCVN